MVNPLSPFDTDQSLISLGSFGPRASARAMAYPVATLAIGLGQTGWEAVSLLNAMAAASYSARDQANVQCFAVARRPPVIPEGRLRAEQRLLLELGETDWAHVPGRYAKAGVAQWWPKAPRNLAVVSEPTAVRSYGRLLLYENPALVFSTLEARVREFVSQSVRPSSDGRRLVILLASIAEAEGSGLLLDMAHLLRTLLVEHETTFVAILSVATGATDEGARTWSMANAYAALKELDAIMINPTRYHVGIPIPERTRKLTELGSIRLFDYILLTGDETASGPQPQPPTALAEMAFSWMQAQASLGEKETVLAPIRPMTAQNGRFDGYTTFNVSKLGVPVRAAVDLLGSQLAQNLLVGLLNVRTRLSISPWVESMIGLCQQDLMVEDLLSRPGVRERVREIEKNTRVATLMPDVERLKDRLNYRQITDELLNYLQDETRPEDERQALEMAEAEMGTAHRVEALSLRARIDDVLRKSRRQLEEQLALRPTHLTCQQGYSLPWTLDAFAELVQQLNAGRNEHTQQAHRAAEAWKTARERAVRVAAESDERSAGSLKRLLRGASNRELTEVCRAVEAAADCALEYARWTSLAAAWKTLAENVDKMQDELRVTADQVRRTAQSIERTINTLGEALDLAARHNTASFPAGTLFDSEWYRQGVASAGPLLEAPYTELMPRVFKYWAQNRKPSEQHIGRFLRDLVPTCTRFVINSVQFAPLQSYLIQRPSVPSVQKALADFQHAAVPAWLPQRETTGWTAHEWLRRSSAGPKSLALRPTPQWEWKELISPDPDEMCLIRLIHGLSAEQIDQIRGPYFRAYESLMADGVPLHLDRRWEPMLPDLRHSTTQNEVSVLWELAHQASKSGVVATRESLNNLIRMLAVALRIDPQTAVKRMPEQHAHKDFALAVFSLQNLQLKLPPSVCPVVFSFGNRPSRELAQNILEAVSVGFPKPFLFIVNVNNRPDMHEVADSLRGNGFNVVILDEANFKSVVSSQKPMSTLIDIVLANVDLTQISPFYDHGPVPDGMFFGRDSEIQQVRSKIATHSVVLIGGRRIGKTSTLQKIQRMFELPESSYMPVYLDCHMVPSYETFFETIERRWEIKPRSSDPTCFEDVVTELKRRLKKQLVFLFDEVDRLLDFDQRQTPSEQLFRTFRSLSNEKRCQFVFSGERYLARATENANSPFFNFAELVRLELLDKTVVARLVTEPFDTMNIWLDDGPRLINRIFEVSAGHPNIVQMICQAMVARMNYDKSGLLTYEHLEHTLDDRRLQEDIVRTFWGQMSPLARLITLLWPLDQRRMVVDEIISKVRAAGLSHVAIREVQDALKDLALYHFIKLNGRECELVPIDFPALIDRTLDRDLEIDALIEEILQPTYRK